MQPFNIIIQHLAIPNQTNIFQGRPSIWLIQAKINHCEPIEKIAWLKLVVFHQPMCSMDCIFSHQSGYGFIWASSQQLSFHAQELRSLNHLLPQKSCVLTPPKSLKVTKFLYTSIYYNCLVVDLPLWKIWVRQLGLLFPIYGKSENYMVQNHQPAVIKSPSTLVRGQPPLIKNVESSKPPPSRPATPKICRSRQNVHTYILYKSI